MASDSHVQNDQAVHSYSMEENLGAPPAVTPILSAHSAMAQGLWLLPATVGAGVAEIPAVAVMA